MRVCQLIGIVNGMSRPAALDRATAAKLLLMKNGRPNSGDCLVKIKMPDEYSWNHGLSVCVLVFWGRNLKGGTAIVGAVDCDCLTQWPHGDPYMFIDFVI